MPANLSNPTNPTTSSDATQRFLFNLTNVRGELTQLTHSYSEILAKHNYPANIETLLGELLAAAALLTATVKLEGILSLEVRSAHQGDNQVSLLMAECSTNNTGTNNLRAVANYKGQPPASTNLEEIFGKGQLVITLDPYQGQRYQGIVSLNPESLAASLEDYFANSEQLATKIWLATANKDKQPTAAGFLLQQLPDDANSQDPDAWARLTSLAATLTTEELTQLTSEQLLFRLFHEEELRLFTPNLVKFACSCSRERLSRALVSLGEQQINEILQEEGQITTSCHFCNSQYQFTAVDLAQAFGHESAANLQ